MRKLASTQRLQVWAFGLTIFVSAFLLFQVQPMIGKMILPWFGGGPSVWTASMLFFQTLLLGGYSYAHLLNRLSPHKQARLHLILLGLALGWVFLMAATRSTPITPGQTLKPSGSGFPGWQVLWVLSVSIGFPYFLLATTSSLAQSWFSHIQEKSSPYPFYALSNAASLAALLSYPILFEPNWALQEQARFWSIGFVIYLALIGWLAYLIIRMMRTRNDVWQDREETRQDGEEAPPKPTTVTYSVWIILAAVPSMMLLAVTNQITQDVAAVPFLWVLPLSLYLISFIFAFSERLKKLTNAYVLFGLIACGFGYLSLEIAAQMSILELIIANAIFLLAISLMCHSLLYAHRPHPRYLTSFYLMLSIGGALGGILVGLVAPNLFPDFWEYPIGLITSAAVAVYVAFRSHGSWIYRLRFPMALAAMGLAYITYQSTWDWIDQSVYMSRNFYGVLRVRQMNHEDIPVYNLVHGRIIHGSQALEPDYADRPTRYYSPATGIGLALTDNIKRAEGKPLKAGMVGLGIGTISAYGQPGDLIRFYEIDPDVVEIAQDEQYFSFLADSEAKIEIVLGDARLSMEKELQDGQPQGYDILAVDAFSGDSIPTHLINREAVVLYLSHLAEDGVLAFHVSNRHLNLEPVVTRLADEFGLIRGTIVGGGQDWLGTNSTWVMLSRSPVALGTTQIAAAKRAAVQQTGLRLWTDDFSNLIQVLR